MVMNRKKSYITYFHIMTKMLCFSLLVLVLGLSEVNSFGIHIQPSNIQKVNVIDRITELSLFPSTSSNRRSISTTTTLSRVSKTTISPTLLLSSSTTTTSTTSLSMCQLLGMNCATPTDFTFSLKGFCKRGGETDIHKDGWGVVFYENNGIRQFHDVQSASTSPMASFLSSYPIKTLNMMGHIRYATVGKVKLQNVHPFSREMWGIQWCFCHNGEVPMFKQQDKTKQQQQQNDDKTIQRPQLKSLGYSDSLCQEESYYHPIGTTDSEAVFCEILNALRRRFDTLPSLPVLSDAIQQLCREIVAYDPSGTICNFLLSCGPHTLWVYSWPGSRPGSKIWNGLYYTVRDYPFSNYTSLLDDCDYSVDFSSVTTDKDCVSVIATSPLTPDEEWIELSKGELLLFDQGRPHIDPKDLFRIELNGHGLRSTVLKKSSLEKDMKKYKIEPKDIFAGEGI